MADKPRVLVSACLLGVGCRYDGQSKGVDGLRELLELCEVIPFCPEQLGGLPTPRDPSERRGARVVTAAGADVTAAFLRGAGESARLAKLLGARMALLKAKSPSCGIGQIYDGSFQRRLIPGKGVAAEALAGMGVELYDETTLDALLHRLRAFSDRLSPILPH